MTAKFGYVTTACRLCKDIVPPDVIFTNNSNERCLDSKDFTDGIWEILLIFNLGNVMISGAVPSMVRSVRLYSKCSHMYVNVFPNGTVMARSDGNDQPNLTISTRGLSLDLLIHSPVQDMYLCFNRSRLVGRRLTRFQAERQPNCLFKEEFVDGYNRYHLVKNEDRYIGFNRRGAQMRRGKSNLPERQHKCFSLLKEAHDFDINRHNTVIAGTVPKWRPQRRLRPPSQNSIKPPCHGVRHHHGRHQRRRNCEGT